MLIVAFLVLIAELVVVVQVAHFVGILDTIALLVVVSLVGAALVKRAGLGVLRRIDRQLEANQVPTRALVDGLLVLVAGFLVLVPGFLTATAGLLLLLPPVRAGFRRLARRRLERRMGVGFSWLRGGRVVVTRWGGGPVIDVDGHQRGTDRPAADTDQRALPGGDRGRR
jgi:UPF0716 protein FxsA